MLEHTAKDSPEDARSVYILRSDGPSIVSVEDHPMIRPICVISHILCGLEVFWISAGREAHSMQIPEFIGCNAESAAHFSKHTGPRRGHAVEYFFTRITFVYIGVLETPNYPFRVFTNSNDATYFLFKR